MITEYKTEIDETRRVRIVKEKEFNYSERQIVNPIDIVQMLNNIYRMNRLAEEHCYLVCMDTKCNIIGVFQIAHGTVHEAIVSSRDVFMKTLMLGAKRIIVVHNHPSFDVSPSNVDIKLYEKLKQGADLLDVELCDFIIIGGEQYMSFDEMDI